MPKMAKIGVDIHNRIVEQSVYPDTFPLCCQHAATHSMRGKKIIYINSDPTPNSP